MALMGYAQAACEAVRHSMKEDPSVVVLGEDVGRGGVFQQYKGLQQEFGAGRVIDTPISEATIMGAAVGMALAGLKPVVEMRVIDFALCAMDEIVTFGLPDNYFDGYAQRIRGVTTDAAMAAGKKLVPAPNFAWVIAGDRRRIEAGLRELGMDVQIVTPDGELVK